jgi:outer membrane protein OmpA-like peptidoglycan-associated protein
MKKIVLLLIAASGALSAFSQGQGAANSPAMPPAMPKYTTDDLLSRWVIDVNLLGGLVSQDVTTHDVSNNYNNYLNYNSGGKLTFSNGMSYGFDAQLGYFFGKSNHFGIGAGFMYMAQQGDMTMANPFHVEYQSTDYQGNTFRQIVTSDQSIKETLTMTNMNIPILLKYKTRFSKHWGFMADAGALINLQMKNTYTSNASFDYEAAYQYQNTSAGIVTVYDNGQTPASGDILYTKANFHAPGSGSSAPFATVNDWFSKLQSTGYNVGLGVKPNNNSGSVSYMQGSVGLMVRPAFNLFLSDNVALTFGGYFMYQPFTNTVSNSYMLTNKTGDYNSMLNTVSANNQMSYGLNLGVRVFFGKKRLPKPVITSQDVTNPSLCGLSDGTITLHGLIPGQQVTVNYMKDGIPQQAYTTFVPANGLVSLTGLSAGSYTGITATVGPNSANGIPENLANPQMKVSYDNSTNPTESDKCDGTVTLHGLHAGSPVTVSYMKDGVPQPAYTGVVAGDGSATITGLCGGKYSGIVATINSCTANANDITLTSPPPPPPVVAPPVEQGVPYTTPIRFEVNKTIIHESSYPILEAAVKKLNEDRSSIVVVDGYTDITGRPAYNKVLSLKRAKAVKAHLVKMGIEAKRIKVIGHGAKSPAASNDTPEGRMENRRAVMHLNVGE